MTNHRLVNERAFRMACQLVGRLNLREEQRKDAIDEFYEICRENLELYCLEQDRLRHRMNPLEN